MLVGGGWVVRGDAVGGAVHGVCWTVSVVVRSLYIYICMYHAWCTMVYIDICRSWCFVLALI